MQLKHRNGLANGLEETMTEMIFRHRNSLAIKPRQAPGLNKKACLSVNVVMNKTTHAIIETPCIAAKKNIKCHNSLKYVSCSIKPCSR